MSLRHNSPSPGARVRGSLVLTSAQMSTIDNDGDTRAGEDVKQPPSSIRPRVIAALRGTINLPYAFYIHTSSAGAGLDILYSELFLNVVECAT